MCSIFQLIIIQFGLDLYRNQWVRLVLILPGWSPKVPVQRHAHEIHSAERFMSRFRSLVRYNRLHAERWKGLDFIIGVCASMLQIDFTALWGRL